MTIESVLVLALVEGSREGAIKADVEASAVAKVIERNFIVKTVIFAVAVYRLMLLFIWWSSEEGC